MLNPLGVVARAIRGRSSGLGWRGGATAAEPADVRCSKGWGALRATLVGPKGRVGGGGPHRGSGRFETARRGRRRRVRRRSSFVRPCPGRCRGSPGLLVRRGGRCKGVTGFRSAYGPTAARNCLGIGSLAAEVQAEIRPLQGLCARMDSPRDCLALSQDSYST